MNKNILALLAIIALLIIGFALWANTNDNNANGNDNGGVTDGNNDGEDTLPDGKSDDGEEPADADADGEDDVTEDDEPAASDSANIKVSMPDENQRVGAHSLVIVGEARVFENTYQWRVKDEDGNVLDSGFGTADAADIGQYGAFVVYATYTATPGERGTVEVFNESARDGSEENMVTIPVLFTREKTAKVFFSNAEMTGEVGTCDEVYGVDRLVIDSPIPAIRIRQALWILLAGGVTGEEEADGYTSQIPEGVRINSLKVNDYAGTVTVDFSDEIETGGSCRVTAIRAQIEETVKAIDSSYSVVITVNGGNPDEALQP